MKEIILTQGKTALIDEQDFERVSSFRWCATERFGGGCFYAVRSVYSSIFKTAHYFMHHLIIGNPPKGFVVDHINGNGLDNRRENLRIVSFRQNSQNQKRHREGHLVGASCDRKRGVKCWESKIRIDGKLKRLGRFATEIEANHAYLQADKSLASQVLK